MAIATLNTQFFQELQLDADHSIYLGATPNALGMNGPQLQALWELHPEAYHTLMMRGRKVKTPRWQQAFGKDYNYTGTTNTALPIPELLLPLLQWCRSNIDPRLNGMLVNWYDAASRHYIGAHRDNCRNLQPNSPIVTISFGEARIFRLRPWKQQGVQDAPMQHGDALLIPHHVNRTWTHEVPHFARYTGKRVSVTLRAYNT